MPSLEHVVVVRTLPCLQVLLAFLTVIHLQESASATLLYGARLGTFPKPDFRTNFTLSSNNGAASFREIRHGLNSDPFYVRVYAKPKHGNNSGFCFNGIGSSQSSPSHSSYGGLLYAYNAEFVRIWAPTNRKGHVVFVKDGWGGEVNTQESNEAEVVVEVWKEGPAPTFQIENVIGTQTNTTTVFLKVSHNLRQRPERVVVSLSPVEAFDNQTNPNGGFWFHAVGASQNPDPTGNFGGVIFAYNEKYVRLWSPDRTISNSGCIFIGKEWGGGIFSQAVRRCRVEILIWVNQLPTPTFQSEWFEFKGQRDQNSFTEIQHDLNELPAFVSVQLQAVNGRNPGYVFEAQGATQSDDNGTNEYGGIVFAYDENRVRLWAPSKHDGSKKGYPLLVKPSWGENLNLQDGRDSVMVKVIVYSSKCNGSKQVLYEGNKCVVTLYDSYRMKVSTWSECSSICNNGSRTKSLKGCEVRLKKKTVLSCDFEHGMCGWTSSQQGGSPLTWVRTNTATPEADTGPLWGHPKGSYYVYTDTTGATPEQRVTLTSPNTGGADKCHLRFYWNMYGSDVGTLEVSVNTKDPRRYLAPKWQPTGWSTTGPQGDIFWRSAYVDLEKFSRVYQILFNHTLPEGNCNNDRNTHCTVCKNQMCPAANVAIDDIRLDCQIAHEVHKPEVCKKRVAKLAGCEVNANQPLVTGPAYSDEQVGTDSYIRAVGGYHDLIAVYQFEVVFTADYVVWKQTFAKSNQTNDISFKIDDGDWYTWRSPHKGSHALWTQFYFQQFNLKPGIHRVSLRQEEKGFRLSRLAVVPTKIKMWTDLGMQSRQIPDGLLSAFPLASNPKPRFGRLNGEDAWCSSDHNRGYVYYQVKLPELALLSRVSVQGGQHILQRSNNYWVESFRMKVSLDGEKYTWYRDTGGRQTFQANRDAASIIQHTLMFAAPVRGIRIFPWVWNNWICMRIELYGFYLSSELCASAGPLVKTSEPCVGDRNCGQNAECRQFQASSIQKQVMENKADSLVKNTTGSMQTCHCYPGYHGSSCEHYGCTPSPCLNSGSCAQKNNTFHCTCQPGYHGNTCQHSCPPGNYGYNCSQQCQCTEHGSCDAATGHCNCKQGYQGTYCDQVCGPGYFGYNCAQRCQCKNGASCDRITGSCNCTVGWSGAMCDQPCPWNTWGRGCQLNCSCSKSAKFCHRFIGECVCLPGYIGRTCQHPCPAGLYGHNCSNKCQCQRNSTCSGADGTCACTQEGWTGLLCDQPCPGGYYGANCTQKCKCQNGAACHHVTGSCTCTSGWSGQLCDKPCAQGWWGRNCSIACSCVNGARCNPVSGQCSCSSADGCLCSPGWTGDACAVACAVGSWGANCRKVCSCQSHGVCHQANGSCRCLSGYTGSKCGLVCSQGTYGPNCIHKCSCASATSLGCDPVHGSCKCRPGYMGSRCDMLCPAGTWGTNCSQSCQCTHGSCDQVSGNCTCDRGWQGLLCDQPCAACGTPCPTCHHGSGPCDKASGKCLCSPGFQGDSCLETCLSGYYGDKCQLRCDCANGGICHHVTGRCACKPGWTGPRCARACPGGSYGQNCTLSCSCAQGTCNATDGSCSCNPGYHGYMCDRPCPSGQFGASCSQKCQCRNAAVCDHVTGRCACSAGWTGKLCNVSCNAASSSHGLFGASCLERCVCPRGVPCDPETGTCTCPRGFQGPNCVQACPRGLFGLNCSQECQCMNNGSCDHVSGTCACTPGWTGANCTDRCPAGSYGMLCDAKCLCNASFTDVTTACDPVTGTCNCRPGYQGHRCDERCPEGYFGKNCRQHCSCQNGGICSFIDGVCNCLPGYHGTTCQLSCPSDRYGYNCNSTCLCVMAHALSCDRVDGTCTCSKGHVGVYCENLCPEGTYGLNCASKCTCKNGAACDHVSGSCTCPAGFKGRDCETPCDRATFGPSCAQQCLCRNGAMCNRFNGDCLCAAGFHGDQCTLECPGGRFGVDCKNNCDCNEANTGQCDKKTGACICHAGFRGGRCDEPCEDGFYGEECKTPCPGCSSHVTGPCNKKTGNCTCSAGYEEYYCLDDCPLDRYGLHCRNPCTCSANQICHHINGLCLDASRGKFSLIVNDTIEELSADVVRARNIKRGLENLMYLYFDLPATTPDTSESTTDANQTQARLSMQDENNSSSEANPTTPNPPSEIPRANDAAGPDPVKPRHVFMVRLLEFQVVVKQDEDKATRVVCVLLDNFTVIDGHYVDEVLSRVPDEDVSRDLMVEYYTGKLHKKTKDSWIAMHLTLIIGVSVGFFLIIVLLTLGAIMRRRHKQKQRFAPYKKSKKEQPEFELQPWIGRNTSYLLAFDNPYYDVLAAMGLDDDVEEDYYNPLYDDVSVYSDSGGNTSEDSCHKDLSAMVIRT